MSRYYAYAASGVQYAIVDLPHYEDYQDAGRYFMEYLLTIDEMEKTLLTNDESLYIGIACSCAPEEVFFDHAANS